MSRFDTRVAIVTGAGRGLGRTYAEYLASRGARVVVNNRRRLVDDEGLTTAEQVVRSIRAAGGEAVANLEDVTDPGSGPGMVQQALDTWGRLDILVNNAGIDQHRAFHHLDVAEFRRIFDVNFYGSLYVTHAAYACMRSAGYGRIVMSTSSAGLHGLHGLSAYAAAKGALIALTRTLAQEGAARGVLVNAVAPYATTQMTAAHVSPQLAELLGPELVAPLVAYLVGEQTRVNGAVIVAGKGWFRRAAAVEGLGAGVYAHEELSPEAIERKLDRILDAAGAREFENAVAAFDDFVRQSESR
ncbi:MAG TPA: SDR family NAD(P)-dependent oxidoreductase [Steroidobacteraceae bacterium]|nr:SDR family NAD(P)-dependent oxidoreductase [Steroidobacteraceae bacterium]